MNQKKNQIVVPVNFSDSSEKGIEIAADIATKWNSQITFLHIIDLPEYAGIDSEMVENYLDAIRLVVEEKIDEIKRRFISTDLKVTSEVIVGKSSLEILNYAKEKNSRLIVLGARKYEKMEQLLEGSNAERITRYAPCPVLTIKEAFDITQVDDIVFATDLKSTSMYVTQELKNLQQITGANLHLVKVNTQNDWLTDKQAAKEMKRFNEVHEFEKFKFANTNAETIEDGILNYADTVDAGMIAMSTHGLDKVPVELNNRFITERVMQSSPRLVWTCIPNGR
ncbi:universal stress protein [Fulvivirga sp. RKSG066]|uniref:universal stress protein n=1 Tax=Fulvivirga aurantia TaxID=2529383 RepID=UPI0012BC4049|nr:universal stress protein [Fulvivirga aurantia]MTI22203.1 universal stress protein [Fulvivirga aurantia]